MKSISRCTLIAASMAAPLAGSAPKRQKREVSALLEEGSILLSQEQRLGAWMPQMSRRCSFAGRTSNRPCSIGRMS